MRKAGSDKARLDYGFPGAGDRVRKQVQQTFEDVQWIDPTSRELLDLLIERIARWRVLLLVTFRPEFRPNWAERPQVSHLDLPSLDNAAVTAQIGRASCRERV